MVKDFLELWMWFYITFLFIFLVIELTHGNNEKTPSGLNHTTTRTTRYPDFTRPLTTTKKRQKRTTPARISFAENCDYLAHYCLKAYQTGKVCGRTLYYTYHTFKNYCLLDYVNCMERYEVWQVVHMGQCFTVTEVNEYLRYHYEDDYFLDQYYVLEDH